MQESCGGTTTGTSGTGDLGELQITGTVPDTANVPVVGVRVCFGPSQYMLTIETGGYRFSWMWSPCIPLHTPRTVIFELGDVKREVEITGTPRQSHLININDWPTS